jgi:hypothetical protein
MVSRNVNLSVLPIRLPVHRLSTSDGDNEAAVSYQILHEETGAMRDADIANETHANATVSMTSPSFVSLNYSTPMMIVIAVVLSIVIIATVFGNLLVAISLFRFRSLRTVSNFLIGNLALSDFLLATTVLPLSTVNECLGHWVFGRSACNVWLLVDVLCCTASLWNICVIALDRFTATLYPIWYRERRSAQQAMLYVALVWTISSAVCLPPLLGWNDLSNNYQLDNVTDVHRCILFQTPSYVLYSASMSFFVPFFVTVFLYVQIFIVLRKQMRKMRNKSPSIGVNNGGGNGAASGSGSQRPRTAIATAGSAGGRQVRDDNRLLLPPEAIGADGVTISADSSITVVEMETFHSSPACAGRRSTDQISLRSLCSDAGGCIGEDPGTTAAAAAAAIPGQQRLTVCVSQSSINGEQRRKAEGRASTSYSALPSDCLDFIRRVTMAIGNRQRRTTSAAADDDNSVGNGLPSGRRAVTGIRALRRRTADSETACRFDDDGDVRTALMATSAPGTPEINTASASSAAAAAANNSEAPKTMQQRRRQRFRRFAASSSGVFRLSTSSTNTDPRGATLKSSAARRFEQREMQATIRMAIIIAFFCGMWLGFFTVYVIQSWCPPTVCAVPRALEAFFFWLGYSNSSVNPILYTIFNDDFRRAFRKLISSRPGNGFSGRDQLTGSRVIDRPGGGRDASIMMKNDRA